MTILKTIAVAWAIVAAPLLAWLAYRFRKDELK